MYKIVSTILMGCFIFCGSYAVYDLLIKDLFPRSEEASIVRDFQNKENDASEDILDLQTSEGPEEPSAQDEFSSQGNINSTFSEIEVSESNIFEQIDNFSTELRILDEEISNLDNIESDQEYWQKLYLTNPEYNKISHSKLVPRLKYSGYKGILSKLNRLENKIDEYLKNNSSNLKKNHVEKLINIKSTINISKGLSNDKIFFAKSAMEF